MRRRARWPAAAPIFWAAAPIFWVGIVYLGVFALLPHGGFWTNDNGLKFLQVGALDANGYRSAALPWPGQSIDPDFAFSPLRPPFGLVRGGELHAAYSPVFALASSVGWQLLGRTGLHLLPILGALATLAAVRRLALRLSPWPEASSRAQRSGQLAVVVTAFAGPLWFYTYTIWEHTAALALACWSLLSCLSYREAPSTGRAARTALLGGLAIYLRTDAYLFAAILAFVAFAIPLPTADDQRQGIASVRTRDASYFAASLFLTLVPLWSLHYVLVGNPFGLHLQAQEWSALDGSGFIGQRFAVARNVLLNSHPVPGLSIAIAAPFLALAFSARADLSRGPVNAHRRVESRIFSAPWLPALVLLCALLGGIAILLGHLGAAQPLARLMLSNGLFAVSPIAILALLPSSVWLPPSPGAPPQEPSGSAAANAREARRVLLWVLYLSVGLYAALVPLRNSIGLHWGCRFVLIAYPLLGALSAPCMLSLWQRRRDRWLRGLLAATLVVSLALQLYSLALLHSRLHFSAELTERVATNADDLIIATAWNLPQELARIFYQRPIFLVDTREELVALLDLARRAQMRSVLILDELPVGSANPPGPEELSDGWLGSTRLALRSRKIGHRSNPMSLDRDPTASKRADSELRRRPLQTAPAASPPEPRPE